MRDKFSTAVSTHFQYLLLWLGRDIEELQPKDKSALAPYPHLKLEEADKFISQMESIRDRVKALRDEWELLVDFENGGGA